MNLQSSSKAMDKLPHRQTSNLNNPYDSSSDSSDSEYQTVEAESIVEEDVALAKAATLMLDQQPQVEEEACVTPDTTELKYIQGIIQAKGSFIVTNLVESKSQTLIQPQMVWTIGRNREAALPMKDRMMSRHHAVLMYVFHEGFYLIDLNSMNGSYINGVRIQQRQLLNDGDRVRLGNTEFIFLGSRSTRALNSIHPEVMSRLNSSGTRLDGFIDYLELEEPEILFKTVWP